MEPLLLTAAQVRAMLNVGRTTMYEFRHVLAARGVKRVKFGKKALYERKSVERFLAELWKDETNVELTR